MNTINRDDFFAIVEMLNASDEDRNIAYSNIKNLDLKEIFNLMFIKCSRHKDELVAYLYGKSKYYINDIFINKLNEVVTETNDENATIIFHEILDNILNKMMNDK